MSRSITPLLVVLVVAVSGLGCFVAAAQADTISGTFDGTATLTPTGTPGIYTQNFSGDGDDTAFGSFTPSSASTIDFSNPPSIVITNGMLTETFSNGTLFGTTSGSGKGNGQGTATFTIDFVITGGTGHFAGDTGEATLTGTITQTSATTESISNGSYSGTLNSPVAPLPSPAWMISAGMVAVCLWGFRHRTTSLCSGRRDRIDSPVRPS